MLMPNITSMVGNVAASRAEAGSIKGKQSGNAFDLMLSGLKTSSDVSGIVNKCSAQAASFKADTVTNARKREYADKQPRTDNGPETGYVESRKEAKLNQQAAVTADTEAYKPDSEVYIKTDEEPDNKSLLERISALLSVISELVMSKLEMNAEEFNKLLEELNMTAIDLLDANKLQSFVLAGSSEENVLALLTNEKLSSVMMELNLQIEGLMAEAGLPQDTDIDRLKDLMADIGKMTQVKEADMPVDANDSHLFADKSLAGETGVTHNPDGRNSTIDMVKATNDTEAQGNIAAVSGSRAAKDSEAFDQDNTALEQNMFKSFIDNMVNSLANQTTAVSENQAIAANLREIAYQIIDRIRLEIGPDKHTLELSLSPESLGRVKLTIESREGIMAARFVVENQISKEAIESQLASLRDTLNQQGIKVEAIEVTVSAYTFDQNSSNPHQSQPESEKSNSGRHISLEEAMAMSEDISQEGTIANNEHDGSQINYVA